MRTKPLIVITYSIILIVALLFTSSHLFAQDNKIDSVTSIPSKYLSAVSSKARGIEDKLDKKSEKALKKMAKLEAKMKGKLQKSDSLLAKSVFGDVNSQYKELQQKLQKAQSLKQYLPHLDTLATSLKFLQQNPELLKNIKEGKEKLTEAMAKVKGLESQFQKADEIKKFLKERKQYLKEQLGQLGFAKEFKQMNKDVYYYSQQVNEYKDLLKDPKKAEKKAIELLSKTKLFQNFMQKNSMLASFFPMPSGGASGQAAQAGFAGLQTRTGVMSFIQNQQGVNAINTQNFSQALQKNIQSAQGVVDQLRNKLKGYGGNGGDLDMPDFKPNNQKVKSLKKRMEYSTNIQTQKSNYFFPTTTDIGLSAGYKINDNSIIGVGTSIKIGWGKDVQHIKLSGQGLSLRSYLEMKVKSSFYASGGFEYNYQPVFHEVSELYNTAIWRKSALLGISKTISFKSKLFKKTKLQVLYDFLSRQQLPVTSPLKFRIGYVF